MSSSDESEDENLKQILEAADPNLFKNSLYEKNHDPTNKSVSEAVEVQKKEDDFPKSQRYLDVDESFDTDLKIPQSMQEHIAKRLSATITNQVEFVLPQEREEDVLALEKKLRKKWKNRVRLLKDCDAPIKYLEVKWDPNLAPKKKPSIKRRIVEPDVMDEEERVRSSAVSPNAIISGDEVKSWVKRRENKIFRYKKAKSGGTFHFVEPENEFSILRKKNCWSEKYISKNKRK